jgi:hypothetical protein
MALSLESILTSYRQWIGLIFLFSLAFIIVNIAYAIINIIKFNFQKKKLNEQQEIIRNKIDKKLSTLDHMEKSVLREFIIQSTRTLKLLVTDPTVASLIDSHILVTVGQYAQNTAFGFLFNIKINDYAEEKLTMEMLDLPNKDVLTDAEKRQIFNNRPPFMHQLLMFKNYL